MSCKNNVVKAKKKKKWTCEVKLWTQETIIDYFQQKVTETSESKNLRDQRSTLRYSITFKVKLTNF